MTLKEKYFKEVIPEMKKLLGYKNNLAVPKIIKITVNLGLSRGIMEKNPKFLDIAENNIKEITGQKPIKTLARQSISEFKIHQGQIVGLKVTLRGKRMYDLLEKIINVVFPRSRDFRGISLDSVDQQGNLSLGFPEQTVFSEIDVEKIEKLHGLEIAITTTAKTKEEGLALLKLMGFPFKK